jgi:uncharacterized membrane protein YbhN (UPF0104 family)
MSDQSPSDQPDSAPSAVKSTWRRRWLPAIVAVAALAAAVFALRGSLPRPAELAATLRSARGSWLVLAAVAQAVSMGMFARQQRRLLAAFGVPMSLRRSLALTYARSAIAIVAPAGAAVSAGYAFRQFRARGASQQVAAVVMVMSGVLSLVALALLYVVGAAAVALAGPVWHLPVLTWPAVAGAAVAGAPVAGAVVTGAVVTGAAVTGAAVAGVAAVVYRRVRRTASERGAGPGARARAGARQRAESARIRVARRWPRATRAFVPVGEALAAIARLPRRDWLAALAFAAANWLCDLACLIAVAYAFNLPLTVVQLAAGYLAVQLVRQVPATPGGVGVIEASLLLMLVSAGTPQAPAAAVVLVYRLLSCWAVLPVGLVTWAVLRGPRSVPGRSVPGRSAPGRSAPHVGDGRGTRGLADRREPVEGLDRAQHPVMVD